MPTHSIRCHSTRTRGCLAVCLAAALALACDDSVTGAAPLDAAPGVDASPPRVDMEPPGVGPDRGPSPDAEIDHRRPRATRVIELRPAAPKLDLIWLVDDSSSMCGEQIVVPGEIAAFGEALVDAAPTVDLVTAVVSTDLDSGRGLDGRFIAAPAPAIPTPGCIDLRDGLPHVPRTDVCEGRVASGRMRPLMATHPTAEDPRLGHVDEGCEDLECERRWLSFTLECLTTLGVRGDDFAAGLGALQRALSCDGANAEVLGHCCADGAPCRPLIVRPDALRVIMIVADSDDCTTAGEFDRSDPANCTYKAEQLVALDGVIATLAALDEPSAPLRVLSWLAPPVTLDDGTPITWEPVDPARHDPACARAPGGDLPEWRARCCQPDGRCVGPPRPGCSIGPEGATWAPRYAEVAAAFGDDCAADRRGCLSICDQGMGAAMAERVSEWLRPTPRVCLDAVPDCDGGPDCDVAVEARCLVEGDCEVWRPLDAARFELVEAPDCGGGRAIRFEALPATAELRVAYAAELPAGPQHGCGQPERCAAVDPIGVADADDPQAAVGLVGEAWWRCAVPGGACGGGWCVNVDGAMAGCTIECGGADDCPIGACHALAGACDAPGACFCGP